MDEEIEEIFRPFDIYDEWNEENSDELYLLAINSCGGTQFKKRFEEFIKRFEKRELND